MKAANALDPAPVNAHLLRLADLFRQFDAVLAEQTRSVVEHRFDDIGTLADRQAVLNEEMKTAESELTETLAAMTRKAGLRDVSHSLTVLEPYLADPGATRELRSSLKSAMADAREKQNRLLQLLQFGQKNITDTLRAINQLALGRDARYDSSGRLVEHAGGRVLNRRG